ncbi:MAG TPA: hypothetical protein VGI20_07650 [Rhizomicrobium sp.]
MGRIKRLQVWLTVAITLAGVLAHAMRSESLPLKIDGRPVDPSCLLNLAKPGDTKGVTIDLHDCRHSEIVVERGPSDPKMIGFEYRSKKSIDKSARPYFYYRFLGFYRRHALLFIEFGSGGAGEFTRLVGVDHHGNALRSAEVIADGDRCNGSIFFPFLGRATCPTIGA